MMKKWNESSKVGNGKSNRPNCYVGRKDELKSHQHYELAG